VAVLKSSGSHEYARSSRPGITGQVETIVEDNIQSGRFERVCNFRQKPLSLEEYTDLVTTYYGENRPFISRLERGEAKAWEQLSRRLFRAAYNLLLNQNWDLEQAHIRAQEATQEACLSIYCRVYPYDCPFDAWVLTILRHHVFRSYHRPRNPLNLPNVTNPLEKALPEKATKPTELSKFERSEPLLQALGQLRSVSQRQVIDCLFFQELSPQETAQKLGKSVQAIYNLKGRALAKLSKLLEIDELK